MKADIDKTGTIVITAETPTEAFAIEKLTKESHCEVCGAAKCVLFNMTVIRTIVDSGYPYKEIIEELSRPDGIIERWRA